MTPYRECEECGEQDTIHGWCKPCQINNFKKSTNRTCGNEKINDLIQEMQSKINSQWDTIFEWIPYNQFDFIEEISKGDFATVYSAIWKNGPLYYNYNHKEYTRKSDKKVALKFLHQKSQNITKEFLNEVWNFLVNLSLIYIFF